MIKFKPFIFVTLLSLLFSCGGGENPSNNENNSSEEIINTSSEEHSSVNNEETSSTNDKENLIYEKFDTREKLLNYFKNIDSNVKSYKVEKSETNSYETSKFIYDYQINNNEILVTTNTISETDSIIETVTEYNGLIDDTLFYLYKNSVDDSFNRVTRDRYDSLDDANQIIAQEINDNSLYSFINNDSQGLGKLFDENSIEVSYRITIDETISIRSKVTNSSTELMLMASFDTDLNFIQATFTKNGYTSSSWDEEKNSPIAGATKSYTHEYIVSNVTYGRENVSTTSISFDGYFIESLSGTVNLYTTYVDTMSLKTYKSEANKLFVNSAFDTYSLFDDGLTYTPSTALDKDSITVTSSSNHNAVYQNQYGSWTTGSTVGEKARLTIGNDYHHNMIEVEVEIVELNTSNNNPTQKENLPIGGSINEWGILDLSTHNYIWTNSIQISNKSTITYGLPTDNEGPFTNLDEIVFNYTNEGIANIKVAEMNSNLNGYSAWNVYFDIEALQVGTTSIDIKLNNSILWTLKITVK